MPDFTDMKWCMILEHTGSESALISMQEAV